MDDTPLIMVEDDAALAEVCATLREEPVIGVDTEADSMYHYREKLCLIQISDRERDYIVDPLKISDMTPLQEIIEAPEIQKIFHGADYDVVSMNRDFGFQVRNLFDTMLASQFLDFPRVGLADLCERFFGVHMDKRFQRHDWSQRPLLQEHLDYARGDTHYLLALREILLFKLNRTDRLSSVQEEFEALEERRWTGGRTDDGWMRMKRTGHLEDPQRHVLRALWRYREIEAERMDRPPFKVLPDRVLITLAERRPKTMDAVGNILRPKSPMFRRHGEGLFAAVQAGVADTEPLPSPPKKQRVGHKPRYGSRETERLFLELKEWRVDVMKRDDVPMIMVASNNQLREIAGFRPKDIEEIAGLEGIRRWQVERYSEELLAKIAAFEAALPERAEPEPISTGDAATPTRRRRRRRRRRRTGDDASGSASEAAGSGDAT